MALSPESKNPRSVSLRLLSSRLAQRDFCPALVSTFRGIDIVRILSPDLREPFVSASRLFLCCSISPVEGLLRFNLQLPLTYDVSLAGLAPFDDIWVNLKVARSIARELQVLDALSVLLDWESRPAWTTCEWVRENTRVQLVQNWVARLCERPWSPFYKIDVTPGAKHVNLLDVAEIQPLREPPASQAEHTSLKAWEQITVWSSFAYEEWRDQKGLSNGVSKLKKAETSPSPASTSPINTIFPAMLFDTMTALEEMAASSTSDMNQIRSEHIQLSREQAIGAWRTSNHPRERMQGVMTLAASFGRLVIRLRLMSIAMARMSDNLPMHEWLTHIPAGQSPPHTPAEHAASPSQAGTRTPSLAKILGERDALAERLSRLEKKHEKLLGKVSRSTPTDERVRVLEARLAEVEGERDTWKESASHKPPKVPSLVFDETEDADDQEGSLAAQRRLSSDLPGRPRSPGTDSNATVRPTTPMPPEEPQPVVQRPAFTWSEAITILIAVIAGTIAVWCGLLADGWEPAELGEAVVERAGAIVHNAVDQAGAAVHNAVDHAGALVEQAEVGVEHASGNVARWLEDIRSGVD